MKNKKLPNRLTNFRLILSLIIIILLLFPFNMININFKKYLIDNTVIVDTKMIIIGVLFIISSITDFLDGYLARKYNSKQCTYYIIFIRIYSSNSTCNSNY